MGVMSVGFLSSKLLTAMMYRCGKLVQTASDMLGFLCTITRDILVVACIDVPENAWLK
jgi:hypothetical protein